MQQAVSSNETLAQHYTNVIDVLGKIAESYYYLGRLDDALKVLQAGIPLIEASEMQPQDRLKWLLQSARLLVADYYLTNQDADRMFSAVLCAREAAESAQDRQRLADALSLLGQAHYYATLNGSTSLKGAQGQYQEALAFQQQALEHREALQDTRGISESLFFIGVVHERWHQHDRAQEYYIKAHQVAEQAGHEREKAEPARHLAGIAWIVKGELDQALVYARESLAIWESLGFQPYLPFAHLLVGDIALAKGDTENALFHCQKAATLAETLNHKRALASSLLSLGDIQLAKHEPALARANFEQALALAQELPFPLIITRASERLERLTRQ